MDIGHYGDVHSWLFEAKRESLELASLAKFIYPTFYKSFRVDEYVKIL